MTHGIHSLFFSFFFLPLSLASFSPQTCKRVPTETDVSCSYQICGCFNLEEHPFFPSSVSPLIRSGVAEETQRLSGLTRCERRRGGRLSETHPQLRVTLVTDFGFTSLTWRRQTSSLAKVNYQGNSFCFVLLCLKRRQKKVISIRVTCFRFVFYRDFSWNRKHNPLDLFFLRRIKEE